MVLLSFPARVGGRKVFDLFGEISAPQSVNHPSIASTNPDGSGANRVPSNGLNLSRLTHRRVEMWTLCRFHDTSPELSEVLHNSSA
jgi:hypothetical protein